MTKAPPAQNPIGVVGVGIMGRGIAQLFAVAGCDVKLFDAKPGAAEAARTQVLDMLDQLASKGRMTAEASKLAAGRLVVVDDLAGLSACRVVVEAIVEDLEAKQALVSQLEAILGDDAVIASNTSSLLIAQIASRSLHPERVAGLHFFNPVPLMKVAEVIAAVRTAPSVIQNLKALVESAGHRAVIAEDQPGFLVNHAGRGLYTEGLAILEDRIASHGAIDLILREAAGFRMGPFELFDLTGLDVSGRVLQGIFEQFQFEPRFRPSSLAPPRIAAGLYGRKSGQGWYDYRSGAATRTAAQAGPSPADGGRVWVAPDCEQHEGLIAAVMERNGVIAPDPHDPDVLILVQPWGREISAVCAERALDPARTVGVDPLPGLDRRRTLMATPATSAAARAKALSLLGGGDTPATLIADSPGFIVQRVLTTIVNIACHIAQRGIASASDIDDAVRLGLGYPMGPLAWGDTIGPQRIVAILDAIRATTGDPRYRVSPWLRQRAALGLSLTDEGMG
ncbi:MAG: 3-hydroxyacyl-CoA dehydrogenase [Hyphomonadaceae bacterium]